MANRDLTERQRQFVAEYAIDLNATQAALRAGYSPKSARVAGSANLRKPAVKKAIAAAQGPLLAALELNAAQVLQELARIARANVLDYVRVDDEGMPELDLSWLTRDTAAALSFKVEDDGGRRRVTFGMHNKIAALDRLARHHGLLRERVSIESPEEPPPAREYDARQVARAICAIFREAAEEDAAEAKQAEQAEAAGSLLPALR
jgi:phage terminase small subunit